MATFFERRKYVQFISRSNTFIALPALSKLGAVKDISQGGLNYEFYTAFGQKEISKSGLDDSITVDIFTRGNRFHIRNIRCRIVYDIIAPEDRPAYSASTTRKRCGLKFDPLTEEQEEKINHFLENHTAGTL